jgi:hypothetical protein
MKGLADRATIARGGGTRAPQKGRTPTHTTPLEAERPSSPPAPFPPSYISLVNLSIYLCHYGSLGLSSSVWPLRQEGYA